MSLQKFESNPNKQTALSLACIAVGAILAYGFRHYTGPGFTDSLAGFLLGLMLLLIGIAAFLAKGKQTIVIDTQLRQIVVEDSTVFGLKKRVIHFSEIVETGIGYLGKRSNHVNFYYINLTLRDGKHYPLFAPGRFFDGSSDKAVMESRQRQLENYLK